MPQTIRLLSLLSTTLWLILAVGRYHEIYGPSGQRISAACLRGLFTVVRKTYGSEKALGRWGTQC